MRTPSTRGKRLTMEETVQVHEWLKENAELVDDAFPNLEQISRRLKSELGIAVTPNSIERLTGRRLVAVPDEPTTTDPAIQHVIAAVEHLYDQLGETRHEGLIVARSLLR